MTVSIHQPNYLPYSGYFNKIKNSDIFIVYDTAQYVKNRWDNRNRVKGNDKDVFLTIPLEAKASYLKKFYEVSLPQNSIWKKKHFKTLKTYYNKSNHWSLYEKFFEDYYLDNEDDKLVDFNMKLIKFVMNELDIKSKIVMASELDVDPKLSSTEALVSLVKAVNGKKYLSGPSGLKYLDSEQFDQENIELEFQNYSASKYKQQGKDFIPGLSILDLIFNIGKETKKII